ncbi:enoyl-CoA hydratase/isomerase family protein [Aquincola sp. S2]|uniref:Enoyl-CoA hydratase/isomerase family protein n=1 Tax=Pseudaquabacterium terrae TaxID=2732868 RepID=A0ABX2EUA6_9BURK|nr:enoyl-CoA hydratase-related protein [Aquabacterium terrae]NRF72009.1 enoyl-CoA hydratase/isomerase family protein [Aquabacterium terrae]
MDHTGYHRLLIERRDAVLRVTLNNPDKLNAIDFDTENELLRLFQDLRRDRRTAVVVLTGAGRAFSAGGDLQHTLSLLDDPPMIKQEFDLARRFVNTLLDVEQPVIARIQGDAVGLGATLALLCDLTVMAEGARIGDPHVRVGLVAGDGGAVAWPLLVGYARAKRYLLGGELLGAAEAERCGLVSLCVPDSELDATVDRWAARWSSGPRYALQWTKATLNIGLKAQAAQVLDAGLAYEMVSLQTADHREAIEAFLAKRAPQFTGQ